MFLWGCAHTCLLNKKYKLRVTSVKMAERGPLGNYHASETLKILAKKKSELSNHEKTRRKLKCLPLSEGKANLKRLHGI